MIITIHQPDFLPWLGFFDRWKNSDMYIILDDVQFLRRGWHHRDRIKTAKGAEWLTVPVCKKGKYNQLIRDVRIDNSTPWQMDHLKTIEHNYRKAPNFERCFAKIKDIYGRKYIFLVDLNMDLLNYAKSELGIQTPSVPASRYGIKSASTQRLVELVKAARGSVYLTGSGSRGYLEGALFDNENIEVKWQEYSHPVYRQLHGDFIPMLSVLDYLMMRDVSEGGA